ncbi:DUF6400 family protein [Streptomyces sp. NPDC006012]|uniref:DUF6400 family protein n=1 Tax=Streptomyces sp. NPDC006012 TaxID=3364739 RepID=UPI0036CEDC14
MSAFEPPSPAGPGEPARHPGGSALFDFDVDLTRHEVLRRAHVLEALGPDWDPVEALRGEEAARDLLYSDLDEEQQRVYDDMVAAGVLPPRGGGRAAA